jgi:hypothetical protein
VRALALLAAVLAVMAALLVGVAVNVALQASPHVRVVDPYEPVAYGKSQPIGPSYRCNAQVRGSGDAVAESVRWGSTSFSVAYSLTSYSYGTPLHIDTDFLTGGWADGGPHLYSGSITDVGYPAYICLVRQHPAEAPVGLIDIDIDGPWPFSTLHLVTPEGESGLSVVTLPADTGGLDDFRDVNGHLGFLSEDGNIAALGVPSDSKAYPLEVLQLDGDHLTDVTRHFPHLIESDARGWWSDATNPATWQETDNFYGAWLGDECQLGRGGEAWSRLTTLARLGHLRKQKGLAGSYRHWAQNLLQFLHDTLPTGGYCTPRQLSPWKVDISAAR